MGVIHAYIAPLAGRHLRQIAGDISGGDICRPQQNGSCCSEVGAVAGGRFLQEPDGEILGVIRHSVGIQVIFCAAADIRGDLQRQIVLLADGCWREILSNILVEDLLGSIAGAVRKLQIHIRNFLRNEGLLPLGVRLNGWSF